MTEAALPNVANGLFSPEPASPGFMLDGDDKYLDVFARDLLMQAGSNADWALPELDIAGIPVRLAAHCCSGTARGLASIFADALLHPLLRKCFRQPFCRHFGWHRACQRISLMLQSKHCSFVRARKAPCCPAAGYLCSAHPGGA